MESDANVEAANPPEIRVFAMFPHDPQSASWNWVHCLTFPVDTLKKLQFSLRLYKWIRYAIGVVVGAQGDLSFSLNSPVAVIDYDAALPSNSADLYYHVRAAERRRMFPMDPDMSRTTVTSSGDGSSVSSRRAKFRSDLEERDGKCVLSEFMPPHCDAVHLLAHSKGNEYIRNYTQCRGRGSNDIVNEIDDIRNGILLNRIAHPGFGKMFAFLATPNFAMSTADIDSTASSTMKRCTAHLFTDNPRDFGDPMVHSGSPVQVSATNWPPDILFDAVYASAVYHHFSARALQDRLKQWKSTFYPRRITNAAQASHQAILDERAAREEKRNEQINARRQRLEKRNQAHDDCDDFDLLMLPYILIPPDRLEAAWREAEEKKAERERSHLEDKVMGWAKQVANACS